MSRWAVKGSRANKDAVAHTPDLDALDVHFQKVWIGDKGESYCLKWSADRTWTCTRTDTRGGLKLFTVWLDEDSGLVWWGSMYYFFDPAEVTDNPDRVAWYAATDRSKRRPRFTWKAAEPRTAKVDQKVSASKPRRKVSGCWEPEAEDPTYFDNSYAVPVPMQQVRLSMAPPPPPPPPALKLPQPPDAVLQGVPTPPRSESTRAAAKVHKAKNSGTLLPSASTWLESASSALDEDTSPGSAILEEDDSPCSESTEVVLRPTRNKMSMVRACPVQQASKDGDYTHPTERMVSFGIPTQFQ
eukprot:gb/GFBE01076834.1/.p1 GENE.gb/GFBE01076834.1/~~gb/GFBE01076834.1/.p1  ORF type:complete len:299 (+),score=34.19 gb/GFBE01076834.1/:1-897(+)